MFSLLSKLSEIEIDAELHIAVEIVILIIQTQVLLVCRSCAYLVRYRVLELPCPHQRPSLTK